MGLEGLRVETKGAGRPLVFSHGFASSSATWVAVAEALAEDFLVIVWDMRGHGESPALAGDYSRDDALADLRSIVGLALTKGDGRPVLVGHSFGGYLSLAHTINRPETVAGLGLVSAGPGFRNPQNRADYNQVIEKIGERAGLPAEVTAVAIHHDSMVIDRLSEITCPAVVVNGSEDLPVYRTGAQYMAGKLGADLVTVEGAGHEPQEQEPVVVAGALRALMAKIPG